MTSSLEEPRPLFRWNAVCIDCAPGDFEEVIAFYSDMLGLQVEDKEERGPGYQHTEDHARPCWTPLLPLELTCRSPVAAAAVGT